MKFAKAIGKNLKLLFRKKETAFTIIFGPILIILLVSFAFSGSGETKAKVGVSSQEYTPLADKYVQTLNDEKYFVSTYSNTSKCISEIEKGSLHACLEFPEDFRIENNKSNEITFYADFSRINLVYMIIDSLSKKMELQSSSLSYEMTKEIIEKLTFAKKQIREQKGKVGEVRRRTSGTLKNLSTTGSKIQFDEMANTSFDLKRLRGKVTHFKGVADSLEEETLITIEETQDLLSDLESGCDSCSNSTKNKIDSLQDSLNKHRESIVAKNDGSEEKLREAYDFIDALSSGIEDLRLSYQNLTSSASAAKTDIGDAVKRLEENEKDLNNIKGSLMFLLDSLESLEITQAESITSPVTTKIEPISSESSNLTFTYPYILMLVIMFMGLLLSSSLIVADKKSRAAFRSFTTSTPPSYQLFLSFVTSYLIIVAQVLAILLLSFFFIQNSLFRDFGVTSFILAVAIALFSFFGMIIGHLSNSQESATISSITIGSILLFVSNLVIPIESMDWVVRILTKYNPYVVLSELLKKSILFGTSWTLVFKELSFVFGGLVLLVVVLVMVQRYNQRKFFQKHSDVGKRDEAEEKDVKPLELPKGRVEDAYDLLHVLDKMTRDEFSDFVNKDKNAIKDWVKNELEDKKLISKVSTRSKERMMIRLDKYLKKRAKKRE